MTQLGKAFLVMLVMAMASTASAQQSSIPAPIPFPQTYEQISQLQERLRESGCYKGRIDGVLGPLTYEAIRCSERAQPAQMDKRCNSMQQQPIPCHPEWPTVLLKGQNFPPYVEKSISGSIAGAIPNVVWTVCQKIKYNCIIELADNWQLARHEFERGDVDGLIAVLSTSKTEQSFLLSTPIARGEFGLFVRDDDPINFQGLSAPRPLNGYRLLVYCPSGACDLANEFRDKMIEKGKASVTDYNIIWEGRYSSTELVMRALSGIPHGAFAYSNRDVGKAISKQLSINNLRYAGRDQDVLYHVAFKLDQAGGAIKTKFDEAFIELCQQHALDGFYYAIERPDACNSNFAR